MRVKYPVLGFFVVLLVLAGSSGIVGAVSTRGIDRVRDKGVLDAGDFEIIERFVAEAVAEVVDSEDFTTISRRRQTISSRKTSSRSGKQVQYENKFQEAAHKYISDALKEAEQLEDRDRRFKVLVNLLILINELESLQLADLAIGYINNENRIIQYWAVHSVTNSGIVRQLNSSQAGQGQTEKIVKTLDDLVEGACPELIGLMVQFADDLGIRQGEGLLLHIADVRIKQYADWSVDNELLNAVVLKVLYNKMTLPGADKAALGQRFGQLYSYAIQKYIKGRDSLSDSERNNLVSVLVEVEKSCVSKLLVPQAFIRRALERDNYDALLAEHDRLLGNVSVRGKLSVEFGFGYGRNGTGTAPVVLPKP